MKVIKTWKGDWESPRNFGARIAVGISVILVGSREKRRSSTRSVREWRLCARPLLAGPRGTPRERDADPRL